MRGGRREGERGREGGEGIKISKKRHREGVKNRERRRDGEGKGKGGKEIREGGMERRRRGKGRAIERERYSLARSPAL